MLWTSGDTKWESLSFGKYVSIQDCGRFRVPIFISANFVKIELWLTFHKGVPFKVSLCSLWFWTMQKQAHAENNKQWQQSRVFGFFFSFFFFSICHQVLLQEIKIKSKQYFTHCYFFIYLFWFEFQSFETILLSKLGSECIFMFPGL